jgi:phage-related protein
MADKRLIWIGSSLSSLRAFPEDARATLGYELRRVQSGLEPEDWKPLPAIGPGAAEIRIHTGLEHRVVYVAKFAEAVYVLHAFEKKTQRMPTKEMELARRRYGEMVQSRSRQKES